VVGTPDDATVGAEYHATVDFVGVLERGLDDAFVG